MNMLPSFFLGCNARRGFLVVLIALVMASSPAMVSAQSEVTAPPPVADEPAGSAPTQEPTTPAEPAATIPVNTPETEPTVAESEPTVEAPTTIPTIETEETPGSPGEAAHDSSPGSDAEPTATEAPIILPAIACPPVSPEPFEIETATTPGGSILILCEITVSDERSPAEVRIILPNGWTLADPAGATITGDWNLPLLATTWSELIARLPIEIEAQPDGTTGAIRFSVRIPVVAPRVNDASGDLVIELRTPDRGNEPIEKVRLHLSAETPAEWSLECSANEPVVPGSTARVACSMSDPAWALRGPGAVASYAVTGGWAAGELDVSASAGAFEFLIAAPCDLAIDSGELEIQLQLAPGLQFVSRMPIAVDRAAAFVPPTLTVDVGTVSEPVWNGSSWSVASAVVTLTVDDPSTGCPADAWKIVANVGMFSNGDQTVAVPFTIESMTIVSGSVLPANAMMPEGGVPVAQGAGSAELTVTITAQLPSMAPGGQYSGPISFVIGPGDLQD